MIDRSAAAIKRSVNGPLRSEQMIEQSSRSPRSEAIERPIPIQGSQPKRPEQPSIDRRSPPASQQASGASDRRSIPSERSDRRSTAATAATAAIDRTTATAPRSNTRSPPEPPPSPVHRTFLLLWRRHQHPPKTPPRWRFPYVCHFQGWQAHTKVGNPAGHTNLAGYQVRGCDPLRQRLCSPSVNVPAYRLHLY
jgi:hypothetical protein